MGMFGGGGGGMLGGLMGGGGPGGGGGMFSNNGGGLQMSQIPFIGGLFPNPNEAASRDAMAAAGSAYGAMRPQQAQGYQNMVSQNQNALAPMHQALANMYGGQHGQNSDVTASIAANAPPVGPRPSDNGGHSRSTASDRANDDNINSDPLGGFLNMFDPVGGLSSIGGSFGGMFGLDGGGGGPMNAARGGMSGMSGGGLLGGLLGGGGGGLLGGLGGRGGLMGL